ncbi:MAG: hypothetical protein H0Z24_03205 [Thermosipho sp. (in: Bacteria)]|nr:hypothetical protein [Thermosipho sp. (in: thermotogales)]
MIPLSKKTLPDGSAITAVDEKIFKDFVFSIDTISDWSNNDNWTNTLITFRMPPGDIVAYVDDGGKLVVIRKEEYYD